MLRPSFKKRKSPTSLCETDSEPFEEPSRYTNRILKLGIVEEGTYVPWGSLPTVGLISDINKIHKWVLGDPGPNRNIKFTMELEEEDMSDVAGTGNEVVFGESMSITSEVEDLTDSPFFKEMKEQLEMEKETRLTVLKTLKEEAKLWNTSKYKLISLESQPGKYVRLIRLLLIVADRPFDDEKLSPEEWEHFKRLTPYGTLPVVQKAGLSFGEPGAIIDVLATTFGLMGKSIEEQLIVMAVYDRLRRLKDEHERPLNWLSEGIKDKSKIEWAQSQLTHVILPPAIKEWEKQIRLTSGPFIVASGITLADLAIVDFLESCSNHILLDNLLVDNIAVYDLLSAVKSNPQINLSRTKQEREEQSQRAR